jgi:hypothetical protein
MVLPLAGRPSCSTFPRSSHMLLPVAPFRLTLRRLAAEPAYSRHGFG